MHKRIVTMLLATALVGWMGSGLVVADSESKMNTTPNVLEVTVEASPADSNSVIGAAIRYHDTPGLGTDQEMYYSEDGGEQWNLANPAILTDSLGDPSVGWSADGRTAYALTISCPGVDAHKMCLWRSDDQGKTWQDHTAVDEIFGDKPFLHVDVSPDSPHKDNVYISWLCEFCSPDAMKLARSTDGGQTFPHKITFCPSGCDVNAPSGFASDITTDRYGNVYLIYTGYRASPAQGGMIVLASANGGTSFAPYDYVVEDTASPDGWPIPATPVRWAWNYPAVDADRSNGEFDGSVYVAWADTLEDSGAIPEDNDTVIKVAYKRRGSGGQWQPCCLEPPCIGQNRGDCPHGQTDTATVDRFHPWLDVDDCGVVHVVYYETVDQTSVNFTHTYSTDGGITWHESVQLSSSISPSTLNNNAWGDYTGLSVAYDRLVAAWTDNRVGDGPGQNAYAATIDLDRTEVSACGEQAGRELVCHPAVEECAKECTTARQCNDFDTCTLDLCLFDLNHPTGACVYRDVCP